MTNRAKHIAEYLLLRVFAGVTRRLPYRLALAVAWVHAAIIFFVFRFRAAEAQRRILNVFGDRITASEARSIAWRSMRNTCFSIVEVIRANSGSKLRLPPRIDYEEAFEQTRAQAKTGKGAVLAAPHMGNWELAGLLGPSVGLPMFTIVGVQKNPLVNGYLQKLRHGPGVELIERGSGTMRAVLRKLREGKMLALLPDVRSRQPGVMVDFLGGSANIFPGTALFALQTNVPIYLCVLRRNGWAHHSVEMFGPYNPDRSLPKGEAIQATMQEIMSQIEAAIREAPEQWFWFNKRWILDPLPATDQDQEP